MSIKVHGFPMSSCTARVLLCLHEKGLEFEFVPMDYATSAHKEQAYLKLNPFGLVPAIEDGDLILFESRAIVRYLARKHMESGPDLLCLNDPAKSAIVDTWIEVEAHQFTQSISAIVYQTMVSPLTGLSPNEEIVKAETEKLEKVLDVYEKRLSNCKYLAGDSYTLADLSHVPKLVYFMRSPKANLVTSRLHVNAWWNDISSRPASVKVSKDLNF